MSDVEKQAASNATEGNRLEKPEGAPLRNGWTTGTCATAATKAAFTALLTRNFPDPVSITLPKGETPAFSLAREGFHGESAFAGIVKDAGDDPDVTHGATVIATVTRLPPGSGIRFVAGDGVGTVTKAGLPIAVGEPAINPVPRAMMTAEIEAIAAAHEVTPDLEVKISVPSGAQIAESTWNPRLGILGGISILGTTGIVHPFSCAAWIHSIHRGIDVARAEGLTHLLGATGSTSEKAAQIFHKLPDGALIDMGDFAGGLLKYLRAHPVPRLTIAGGFAKMTKLAQGALDLHSSRSQIDNHFFLSMPCTDILTDSARRTVENANTALEVLEIMTREGTAIAPAVAQAAKRTAEGVLRDSGVAVDIIVTDRKGTIIAHAT
ncbi:cobalt-precorrin-6A synthase [Agrobacterium albertimagni AOL15]|uniref:Cobalt-precorrin-5B C(1)-methyltransferase n=1 Tax=Agrobacterium albertimagni AOL15 TaxID=1156935 RepID=K2QFB2_9HYPH|nr:cobalt-precorrin-5B (C(1))-methyltransferase [Agrobacterium albertimagni]EKF59726.1 cobalt-precorrin-6A synthase [Agrobacterium albertimagni AOL15]